MRNTIQKTIVTHQRKVEVVRLLVDYAGNFHLYCVCIVTSYAFNFFNVKDVAYLKLHWCSWGFSASQKISCEIRKISWQHAAQLANFLKPCQLVISVRFAKSSQEYWWFSKCKLSSSTHNKWCPLYFHDK